MKRLTALALSISLITFGFAVTTVPAQAAKIACKATKAKGHPALKTNPPQKAAKVLPKTLTLKTNCGDIVITLDPKAPFTVTQITSLAKAGYYNKSLCHREAITGFSMLQCGDPTALGNGGPGFTFTDENLPTSGPVYYPAGTVAMANTGQPASNGSQFFLVFEDSPNLGPTYTVWGKITKGLDILRYIASKGVSDPSGIGAPKVKVAIESTVVK